MADKEKTAAPTQTQAPDDEPKSADATFSTYKEVQPETDERPAPGRQVEQEPGKPSESAEPFKANR